MNSQPDPSAPADDGDDPLMVRLQEGDQRAFELLVARHQGALFRFFLAKTGDRQLSEDLTQETLLKVFDQAWDYLPTGRFRGWMFRMARNLLIDNFRRRSSDALVRAVDPGPEQESPLLGLAEELDSPLQKADQREIHRLVDEWLAEFPEDQRLTFCLHHFLGLSLPEVAEILETNVATTKSRLRLAREKLREKLIHRGVLE